VEVWLKEGAPRRCGNLSDGGGCVDVRDDVAAPGAGGRILEGGEKEGAGSRARLHRHSYHTRIARDQRARAEVRRFDRAGDDEARAAFSGYGPTQGTSCGEEYPREVRRNFEDRWRDTNEIGPVWCGFGDWGAVVVVVVAMVRSEANGLTGLGLGRRGAEPGSGQD
jgi:hypothetical protein